MRFALILSLALIGPIHLSAQQAIVVIKQHYYVQTGPSSYADDPSQGENFGDGRPGQATAPNGAFTFSASFNLPGSVTIPGGSPQMLVFVSGDNQYEYPAVPAFTTQAALDAAFPDGNYTLTANGQSIGASLTGDIYPNVPLVTVSQGTWNANGTLVFDPTQALTLTLNFTANYIAGQSHLDMEVYGFSGQAGSYSNSQNSGLNLSLNQVSLTIPANTLNNGAIYVVSASLVVAPTPVDTTTFPGFLTGALYGTNGSLLIQAGQGQSQSQGGLAIATQPQSQAVAVGGTVYIFAQINGPQPITFQWFKNGSAIAGATSPTYEINSAQTSDAGSYYVTATNAGGSIISNTAVLTVGGSGTAQEDAFTTQPQNETVNAGNSASFSVQIGGTQNITSFQWYLNGVAIPGATQEDYQISSVTASDSGVYTLTITDAGGAVTSNGATLTIVSPATGPTITGQPQSKTVNTGSSVALSITAGGTPAPNYQWYKNGAAISGATRATLLLSGATSADTGTYTCVASNSAGSVTSQAAILSVITTSNPGRLINLSTLSDIQGSLSMGFVIGGAGTTGLEPLLIRGVAPAIGPGTVFAVPGVMPDPTLTVVQQSPKTTVATNTGWRSPPSNATSVQAADAATGAFALTNPSSLDSAVVVSLPAVGGGYSATIAGKSGDNGYALTEVYDDNPNYTPASTRLINLSCLTQIAPSGILDVGFVIGGATAKTVLVRVGGPALNTLYGIGNAMPNPQLQVAPLGSSSSILAFSAGWGGNPQIVSVANSVGAYTWPSATSLDSAAVVTLSPGAYTVQVNSTSGAGGTVLVEIYDVP